MQDFIPPKMTISNPDKESNSVRLMQISQQLQKVGMNQIGQYLNASRIRLHV